MRHGGSSTAGGIVVGLKSVKLSGTKEDLTELAEKISDEETKSDLLSQINSTEDEE